MKLNKSLNKSLLTISLLLLLLPTLTFAQAPLPPAEVNLKITIPEAEIIWNGLRKLPVEQVEQLMNKVRQQISEQTQPQPKSVDKDKEPKKFEKPVDNKGAIPK